MVGSHDATITDDAVFMPPPRSAPSPPRWPPSALAGKGWALAVPGLNVHGDRALERRLRRRIDRLRRLLVRTRLELDASRVALEGARLAASSDPLTGLPNRRGFEPPLREVIAQHADGNQVLSLLFVDLDGFKAINDRLGHAVGDALLRIVAERLAAGMRQGDLVCRHGGDEFLCLLPRLVSPTRAGCIAAALKRSIAQPCRIGPHEVRVSASIGIAMFPQHGDSSSSLIRSADAAMYRAKQRPGGVAMAPLGGHVSPPSAPAATAVRTRA